MKGYFPARSDKAALVARLGAVLLPLVALPASLSFAATVGEPIQLVPPAPIAGPAPTDAPTTGFVPDKQFGPPQTFTPAQKAPVSTTNTGAQSTTGQANTPARVPTPAPKPTPDSKTAGPDKKPPATKNTGPTVVATPSLGPLVPPQLMNAAQRDTVQRISAYFNNIRTMKGNFIQIGPNGEQSEGEFYLQRPGKIRFHYTPPVRVDVISDGRSVAVEDRTAMTQNIYPLSKTPLKHLLADRIDLGSDKIVGGYREEPGLVSLVLAESTFGDGKLTMIFDKTTLDLRQWVITDAQGQETSVALYNIQLDQPVDAQLFKIYLTQDFR